MSPQVSVGMIIRYASHNLRFIYSTNTQNLKECPKVSTVESRRKRVTTPMHRFPRSRNPQVDHQNIHQMNQQNTPLSPRVSHARHTSSVLKSLKTHSDKITSKGKTQSITREQWRRNIIRSNYNSKACDTSRSCQIKNTRERSNTQLLVHTLSPEGELLPPRRGERRDNDDGHR